MKRRLNQIAFAAFFTLLGMAIAIMGVVAMDNKTKSATASHDAKTTTPSTTHCENPNAAMVTAQQPTHTEKNNKVNAKKAAAKTTPEHTTKDIMQLRKGTAIVVHDILDPQTPGIEFVPFYNAQGQFDKVAVYRNEQGARSTSYKKTMDMMYPLPKASSKFPPISLDTAQRKAEQYKPNSYPQYQGRLVTFASVDVPYYYFKMQGDNGALLVDALTGMAQVISRKELEEEKKFQEMQGEGLGNVMKVNASGQFYTDPEVLSKLPAREQKIIEAEQTFFNKMIAKGVLKIDSSGNFIEDNMTAEHQQELENIMEKLLGSISAEDMH